MDPTWCYLSLTGLSLGTVSLRLVGHWPAQQSTASCAGRDCRRLPASTRARGHENASLSEPDGKCTAKQDVTDITKHQQGILKTTEGGATA